MCQTIGCCRGSRKFVCFGCRLTAKGADVDYEPTNLKKTNKRTHPTCPRCRDLMENVGMGAVIPKRTNNRKWKSMQEWHEARSHK